MIAGISRTLLPLLKVSERPPEPPVGSHRVLSVERAAKGYLWYLRVRWVARLVLALLGVSVVAVALHDGPWWMHVLEILGLGLALIGLGFDFLVLTLQYELRWYVITDRSLLIREGIWNVREITLTFANVQNVTVTQGPMERLFGISDVVVDTAGGAAAPDPHGRGPVIGHRGHLRGVSEPHRIRDLILELLRRHQGAGLGDPDDERAPDPARGFTPAARDALRAAAEEARALRAALGTAGA